MPSSPFFLSYVPRLPMPRTCSNTERLGMGNLLSEEEVATVVDRVGRDVYGTYGRLRAASPMSVEIFPPEKDMLHSKAK